MFQLKRRSKESRAGWRKGVRSASSIVFATSRRPDEWPEKLRDDSVRRDVRRLLEDLSLKLRNHVLFSEVLEEKIETTENHSDERDQT